MTDGGGHGGASENAAVGRFNEVIHEIKEHGKPSAPRRGRRLYFWKGLSNPLPENQTKSTESDDSVLFSCNSAIRVVLKRVGNCTAVVRDRHGTAAVVKTVGDFLLLEYHILPALSRKNSRPNGAGETVVFC